MMKKSIYIIGTGGFAKEVFCLIRDLGNSYHVKAFVEKDEVYDNTLLLNTPIIPQSKFQAPDGEAVIAIGDPEIRANVVHQLPPDTHYATLIHPSVIMSPWVQIGEGSVICARTTLTCDICLGRHTQLNLHTTIGHDCVLGDFVTTAPAVNISGLCQIGDQVYIGTNASIKQNIRITSHTVIGMSAVVVKDIAESGIYVGNPSRMLK